MIWNIAYGESPRAFQIVDLWHAKEKLWQISQALHTLGECAEQWAHSWCDELELGHLDALLAVLRAHAEACEEARKSVGYIEPNRECIRYDKFRPQGLCVGKLQSHLSRGEARVG